MYIFRRTLRDDLRSILIWGGGLALLMLTVGTAYNQAIGGPNKAQEVASLEKIYKSFTFLVGPAYDLDTLGGFVTTRYMSVVPVILGIFALLAGSFLIRGEEERGSLDLLLSTPHSRLSVFVQKWAGLLVALLLMCLITWAGLELGAIAGKADLDHTGAGLTFLNVFLTTLFFGTLALALGQMTTRKAAAGWTGGVLGATYFMDTLSQQTPTVAWIKYFSPFHYYNLSKPLARSVGPDPVGFAVLAVVTVPVLLAGIAMYLRRDQNSVFELWSRRSDTTQARVYRPGSVWLKNYFTFGLRETLPGMLIWAGAISFYLFVFVLSVPPIRDSLQEFLQGDIYKQLGLAVDNSTESILHVVAFVLLVVIFAAYAITLSVGWSGEETSGHLELILSTPLSRWQALVNRFLVATIDLALISTITGFVCWLSCVVINLPVKAGNLVAAFFGLFVICVLVVAAGFALSSFNPGPATGILAGLVIVSYVLNLIGPLLKLPDWVLNLSIFQQYGKPLINGFNWPSLVGMLALAAVLGGLATFRFEQRGLVK